MRDESWTGFNGGNTCGRNTHYRDGKVGVVLTPELIARFRYDGDSWMMDEVKVGDLWCVKRYGFLPGVGQQ